MAASFFSLSQASISNILNYTLTLYAKSHYTDVYNIEKAMKIPEKDP